MDFELAPDQLALQDAARQLLDARAASAQVRAVVEAGGGMDEALWSTMIEQGWPGIALAEDRGGVGLGLLEAAILVEQVGAHVAPVPIIGQLVALDALARSVIDDPALDPVVAPWIERLSAGTALATVAARTVRVRRDPGEDVLGGVTEPAVYAPSADLAIVIAHDDRDATSAGGGGDRAEVRSAGLYLVVLDDRTRPPREPAMDLTREVGWLRFDQTPAVRLGGPALVEAFVDVGATLLSAELLGASARALELAVAYAKDREQFGRPIGSFQAIKHRCADMLVDVEGMRSAVYYAAWCVAAGDRDATLAASTAKTWCSDASRRVMTSALQVHGGIGFTWECDVHLYLKRAQLDQRSFGDAVFHRDRLARLLRARIDAGERVI